MLLEIEIYIKIIELHLLKILLKQIVEIVQTYQIIVHEIVKKETLFVIHEMQNEFI
jgi:hypothetical protein